MNKTALFIALFYLVFSLYLYIAEGIMFIEFIVYIILILAGFSLVQKKKVSTKAVIFLGMSILWHFAGLLPISYEGRVSTLYDSSFILPHYDLIGHTLGFLFLTLAVLIHFKPNFKNLPVAFLSLMGIGALIEIFEYSGFLIFGIGKGWLALGPGDYGLNLSLWIDTMTDMISNMTGILFGLLSHNLFRKFF